ncbi:MAG: class I SAM-dependent methyltransferase [Rhizobiales bacterium]|nr:class I SAM-dependent methyltransferase [Hyphomicrobiales bacterium]
MGEAKIWDRYAKGYAKRPVADEVAYQKKLEITQSYFTPDMNLLEFGCGTGSTALVHAPYVAHIDAIDVSPNMIEIAQQKLAATEISNITFRTATIEEFKPEKQFDMVLGLSILHLVKDKNATISKVYDLLKEDGLFISSTICLGNNMGYMKYILPIGRFFGAIPTVKVFSTDELEQSLTDAGFTIVQKRQPKPSSAMFIVSRK